MKQALTVGELRKALEGVPDNLEVCLSSDTGVDQGEGMIIVEGAERVKYSFLSGETCIDYFSIYANDLGKSEDEQSDEAHLECSISGDAGIQCSMCGEQFTADEVKELAEMGEPIQFYDGVFLCPDCYDSYSRLSLEEQFEAALGMGDE